MAGYSVTISATDAATGVINKVNSSIEGMNRRVAVARAPFERFNRAVSKFGDATGIKRVSSDVGELGQKIGGVVAGMGRFTPALGALTSAASIAGIARLVENWTTFGSRLGFDAQRINMTASNLQSLQGAARLAGSSAEALTSGMTALGDNLTNAVAGRSPQTVQMLAALGISFTDAATGGARLAQDVLPEIANKIAGIHDPTQRAMIATTLFGAAGESLLPFLRRGAAGIADYNAQAIRYGVLNENGVRAANAMREAQTRLGLAVEGVGYSISERVAPVLVPMLLQFSDWVAGHREDISRFFADISARLKEWVESGGPARLLESIQRIGTQIEDVTKKVGGWGTAFEIAGGLILVKMLSPVVQVMAAVSRLTAAIAVGLVDAFGVAGVAAAAFNTRTMAMPAFRLLATVLGVKDTLQNGVPLSGMSPEVQALLGHPAAEGTNPAGSPSASNPPSWWQRYAPTWLGGSAPPPSPGGMPVTPLQPGQRTQNARLMANVFMNEGGLTQEAAAALLGGGIQESGLNPQSGAGTAHQGIFQLSNERRGRVEAQFGRPLTSMSPEDQARATLWELNNRPEFAAIRNQFRTSHDLAGNNYAATHTYEAPGNYGVEDPRRLANSQSVLNRLHNDSSRPSIPGVVAAPAPLAPPVLPVPLPGGTQGAAGPDGRATVRLMFDNPPPNMRTSTVAQGGLRIEAPTLGNVP